MYCLKKTHTLVRCGLGLVGALAPALALRQRHVLQVLVDHHLQVVVGAVGVGVERHVTLLHGAGGGPLAWGGVCAQQAAQAQFVVAVTRDLHHMVASGIHRSQHHIGGAQLEISGYLIFAQKAHSFKLRAHARPLQAMRH